MLILPNLLIKALRLIIISLMLSGCMGDQCIDADDFGFPRFTVSARYDPLDIVGAGENQVAPWRDNKLTVNGQPLTIVVKNWSNVTDSSDVSTVSAWSPWYGNASDGGTKGSSLNSINKRFIECTWNGNAGGYGHYSDPATRYAMITNAPCLLHKGVGLYALIATKGTNPNSIITPDPPQGITFHVGNPAWQKEGLQPWQAGMNQTGDSYSMFDVNTKGDIYPAGGLVYKYSDADKTIYANNALYFKILDKMYDDNSGQYRVIIKSGINDPYPDPFQYITALVKNQFFGDPNNTNNSTGVIKNIYLQIINNNSYKTSVGALLTLYIMFTAFSFLIGTLQITQTELITRVFKVALVAALLDPRYGWTFFYNYLFVFFIDGTSELINIIQQAANTGGGSSSLLTMLMAPETIGKVLSLLFTSPTGIIYIIVYIVLLVFFVFISFRAASLYISALIMIGMIIIMGPIFLCFMLFDFTKSLFENWLKQLMYYTLQPIILLTSIAFMSMMIRHEIYSTLGFRICRYDFPDLGPLFSLVSPSNSGGSGMPKSLFFWFFPSPMVGSDFSDKMAVIPVPEAHDQLNSDGTKNGTKCAAYECNENRYVDLPFLDPYNPRDLERRNNFRTGTFAQFENLIYIAILIYLMYKFNETAISISKSLNNASFNSMKPEVAAEVAARGISSPIQRRVETAVHKASAPVRGAFREIAFKVENATTGRVARWWDATRKKSVAQDALSKSAHQTVLDRVRSNHNLDRGDISLTARDDYEKALVAKLVEASKNSDGTGGANAAQTASAVKNMLNVDDDGRYVNKHGEGGWRQNYSGQKNLKDLFGQMNKSGKTFEELMNESNTKSGKSLSELAQDAEKTQRFQDAYVQEFQAMSKEGHGFIGKRSATFRKYTEYKQNLKEHGDGFFHKDSFFGDNTQVARGDSLHSGYDSLKHSLSGGLLEGDTMQYNFSNKRMQTYQEELADRSRMEVLKDLQKIIDNETALNERDILRPEYLAKLPLDKRTQYETLRDDKLAFDVHSYLASDPADGKNSPALMGERYMTEKMTDVQFRAAIDRAQDLEQEFIAGDKYLRNIDYEAKSDDVSVAMQQRENAIKAEFRKNIDMLNQYRRKAGMADYLPLKKPKP